MLAILAACAVAEPVSAAANGRSPCHAWAGDYSAVIPARQNLMNADQRLRFSVDRGRMVGAMKGSGSPEINIWSTAAKCRRGKLTIDFRDNGDGSGRLTIYGRHSYTARFDYGPGGSSRSFAGYFPDPPDRVVLDRRPLAAIERQPGHHRPPR
jgi:hypothetical protein